MYKINLKLNYFTKIKKFFVVIFTILDKKT